MLLVILKCMLRTWTLKIDFFFLNLLTLIWLLRILENHIEFAQVIEVPNLPNSPNNGLRHRFSNFYLFSNNMSNSLSLISTNRRLSVLNIETIHFSIHFLSIISHSLLLGCLLTLESLLGLEEEWCRVTFVCFHHSLPLSVRSLRWINSIAIWKVHL
jgi:hypothetical protein